MQVATACINYSKIANDGLQIYQIVAFIDPLLPLYASKANIW